MDIPVVVLSVVLFISDEITSNMDVCEKSESDGDLSVVDNFDPLQIGIGKESVSAEPTILSMDT